jgi:ATP-binding cassette subfamily B protein
MSDNSYNAHSVSSLRFVVNAIYPFRFYLVALIFILLIYSGNVFLKTQLIKMLVNAVVQATSTLDELWALVGHFGVVLLIEVLAFRSQEWCTLRYEPALQNHITELLFKHTIQCDYGFFQKNLAGNLAVKVHDVIVCIPAVVAIFLYDYFINFLYIIVAFATLWGVSVGLALSVIVWSLSAILVAALFTRSSITLASYAAERFSQVTGYMTDALNNVLTIRLFSAQTHVLGCLKQFQAQYLRFSQRYRWFMLRFYTLQGTGFQLYQGLCLLLLLRMHSQGFVTAGEFAMILSLNLIITESLWKMFERMQEVHTLWGKIRQALQVLLTSSCIQDKPNATSLVVYKGTISFNNVTFGYTKTEALFHQKTVHIAARQKIGLVGYSGSGKTTFINLIARLYDVDSGAILIDGQDIRDVTQQSLHKAMMVVTQDNTLFHSTILENIRYGNPNATDSQIIEAAKGACAHTFIMQLPQQYETHVGAQGLCLSGGQRQRIAIARALLKDAPIVLLDEVSAHLDTATEQALNASLAACLRDKTVLTISHKLTTLKQMDRMLVFDNGKVVEDGSHHQLLAHGGYYATLWSMSDKERLFMRND